MNGDFKEKKPEYHLNPENEFVIENYNFSKPFANFLPGIAGKYGIPIWVFYVNRGQAVVSFGTKDKDHAILEFLPANKAWQSASALGFRTFIRLYSSKKHHFYEPFHNGFMNQAFRIENRMSMSSYGLKLEEENLTLGLKTKVEYFTIPQDSFGALARIVTIKNTRSVTRKMQVLDGLPQIVPYGVANLFLKKLSRTIEAWMKTENLDRNVPFYKVDVDPTDRPEVIRIEGGNFYLGFDQERGRSRIIKPVVDPESIFGSLTDLSFPRPFFSKNKFVYPQGQITKNKTPCGFLLLDQVLEPRQEKTFYSIIGNMRSCQLLNSSVPRMVAAGYLAAKKEENRKIIQDLESDITTISASLEFNLYAQQTYLDNILRGGYPVLFPSKPSPTVFYLYSRKHGDLERDYNKFQIQPTHFSQGNGNYRDMNQNRRSDIWFNPEIGDENIITFLSLIQADGFNPLVIKGTAFTLKDAQGLKAALRDFMENSDAASLISFLDKPVPASSDKTHLTGFTPGEVILFIQSRGMKIKSSYDELLSAVLSHSQKIQEADHGEGFWTDHWTYNLDLLESYLGIYPDKLKDLVADKRLFTFYDNPETVKPRQEKYLLKDGLIRQYHALRPDNAKREMIKKRTEQAHYVRTDYGKGPVYQTTLLNKLACLLANKLASLDPFGTGIEMEADKPNWFDSLNGLPGLFGSSLCETLELKRLILFIKRLITETSLDKIYLSEEIHAFLLGLDTLINEYFGSNAADRDFRYWDKSCSLKEDYRLKTRFGFSGVEHQLPVAELLPLLDNALKKVDAGIEKAFDKGKGVYYSYFINEVAQYQPLEEPFIRPTGFIQKKLPFFLESQMHALRTTGNKTEAQSLYGAVRKSQLYDGKLKMYKVCAPLKSMPEEIGRCRVFTPGWLENESVWLHMEYKYMLECLKQGLHAEFYSDFKNALIPFLNPERYGRSILENSSFLVSSVFVDKRLHGNGYVARLSGSTAEFLQMWLIMNLGVRPFFLGQDNQLNLKFSPVLPAWLFTKKDKTYSFNFLSTIKVTYHNPKGKNTFGNNAAGVKRIVFLDKDANPQDILSDTLPSPFAGQVRSRQIRRIDLFLD